MYGVVPDIRDLRLFGSPVSSFHHQRKMKDGTLRGFASIYLGQKEGMSGRGGLIFGHSGSRVVVSNDLTFGEDFQWATNDSNIPFSAINRPEGQCAYGGGDNGIEKMEEAFVGHRAVHAPGVPLPQCSLRAPALPSMPREANPAATVGTNTMDQPKYLSPRPPVQPAKDDDPSSSSASEEPIRPARKRFPPTRLAQPEDKQRYHTSPRRTTPTPSPEEASSSEEKG
jgi:hypothetical protein